ncbi:hypothetical protein ACFLXB_01215 [Chloroflexota bacterium]
MKFSSKKDLNYFLNGVEDLEDYLLSNELYWNLPGLSRLTLGGLHLARARLAKESFQSGEEKLFSDAVRQMEYICLKWRVAYEKKAQWEFTSRLNLWQNFLMDYWTSPEEFGDAYSQEIRWRVMIQLLSENISVEFKEKDKLDSLDDRLKISFQPGDFIWPEELSDQFDEQDYWFLYGKLPVRRKTN